MTRYINGFHHDLPKHPTRTTVTFCRGLHPTVHDKITKTIKVPGYVPDIAKVQITSSKHIEQPL